MSDQLKLALGDRHAGQDANLAAGTTGHRDHRLTVERAVAALARAGMPFTADHVHERVRKALDGDLYDANLVSSVMGIWAKDNRIVEQPRHPAKSIRRSRHASRNRWWCGRGAAA